MANIDVIYSSKSSEWETPQDFFDKLNDEFHFTLDPCCTEENRKCAAYFTREDDGLNRPWDSHVVFMNPPYGREIGSWIKKAYEESLRGTLVVCLIPARTDTSYWHDYVMKAKEIRFIRGRLKFENRTFPSWREDGNFKKSPCNFPCAVIVFSKSTNECPVIRST